MTLEDVFLQLTQHEENLSPDGEPATGRLTTTLTESKEQSV